MLTGEDVRVRGLKRRMREEMTLTLTLTLTQTLTLTLKYRCACRLTPAALRRAHVAAASMLSVQGAVSFARARHRSAHARYARHVPSPQSTAC